MVLEAREVQETRRVVDYSPREKKNRSRVLRQNIADSQRLITSLEEERTRLIMRLSQIPDSIATVRGWIDQCTQDLDKLEGYRLNNGHSTPTRIPSLSSVEKI